MTDKKNDYHGNLLFLIFVIINKHVKQTSPQTHDLPKVGALDGAAEGNPPNSDLVVVAEVGAAVAVDAPPNNDVVPAVEAALDVVPKERPPVAGLEAAADPNREVVPVVAAEEAGVGFVAALLPKREGALDAAGAVEAAPPKRLGFVAAPPPGQENKISFSKCSDISI